MPTDIVSQYDLKIHLSQCTVESDVSRWYSRDQVVEWSRDPGKEEIICSIDILIPEIHGKT